METTQMRATRRGWIVAIEDGTMVHVPYPDGSRRPVNCTLAAQDFPRGCDLAKPWNDTLTYADALHEYARGLLMDHYRYPDDPTRIRVLRLGDKYRRVAAC